MKTSDVTQSVIIFLVYFLLFFSTILVTGVDNVNENWETYRCNPMVMPFAPMFGHDPVENFKHCTGSIQKTNLNKAMKPLKAQLNQTKEANIQNKNVTRSAVHRQRGLTTVFSSLAKKIGNISTNTSAEITKGTSAINNTFKKMAGAMQLMAGTTSGMSLTVKSIKNLIKRIP